MSEILHGITAIVLALVLLWGISRLVRRFL